MNPPGFDDTSPGDFSKEAAEKASEILGELVEKHPEAPYARRVRGESVADDRDLWARMRARPAERFWRLFGGVEGGYDTNLLSIGEDAIVPASLSDKDTFSLQVYGGLGFRILQERDCVLFLL